jgi:hypothetical protein
MKQHLNGLSLVSAGATEAIFRISPGSIDEGITTVSVKHYCQNTFRTQAYSGFDAMPTIGKPVGSIVFGVFVEHDNRRERDIMLHLVRIISNGVWVKLDTGLEACVSLDSTDGKLDRN